MERFKNRLPTARGEPKLLLFILLLALWFLGHPYRGLLGDGVLYAVQALAHLHPETYGKDLFFLYGSQDDFTLFSPIYAAFIRLFGLGGAMLAILLAGNVLWFSSSMLLASRLLRGFPFWLGLVLVIAMSRSYSYGNLSLEYAEPYLSPRLIAEGLTLLSLTLVLRGKWFASLAALAAALAIHPLMALAGVAFVGLYFACDRPKVALVFGALASTVVLLLGWMDVSPFSRLFATMDAEWFQLAVARASYDFWDGWRYAEWGNPTLLAFTLLAAASGTANGLVRRVFLLPLVIGVAALLLFWLGTSVFHNVLLIQLQTWRWLWLTQLFSYLAAAWLVGEFWQRDRASRLLLLGFITAWLTLDSIGGLLAVLVCGLFIWHAHRGKAIVIPDGLATLLYVLPFPAAAWWLANVWLEATSSALALMKTPGSLAFEFGLLRLMRFLSVGGGVISVLIFLAVWRYSADHRKSVHLAAVAGVVFLLMLSLAFWDQQSDRSRFFAQQALRDSMPSFSRVVPVGAVVYWEDDVQMTWFGLGRASYASLTQTVGLIFNRQTAIEGKRRVDRLAALGVKDGIFAPEKNQGSLPEGGFTGLMHVCHDPALDYVILSKDFGKGMIERHFEKMTGKYFYLYDCAYLRRNFADLEKACKDEAPVGGFCHSQ